MKLAIPYDNGQVFQHFGKTEAFKIYDIVDGKVGPSMVMSTNGAGPWCPGPACCGGWASAP